MGYIGLYVERSSKTDPRLQRTAYGPLAMLMDLPYFGIGIFWLFAKLEARVKVLEIIRCWR
jgi:hypothetical protein